MGDLDDVRSRLQSALGVDSTQVSSLLSYLISLGSEASVESYLSSLLPPSPQSTSLISACIASLFPNQSAPNTKSPTKKKKASASKPLKSKAGGLQVLRSTDAKATTTERATPVITGNEKFREGTTFQNCLDCGKIFTSDMYATLSRCNFCDNPLGKSQLKKGRQEALAAQEAMDAALAKALAHRDKLLDYDATSASRTQVYDDQEDYFELNIGVVDSKWASEDERLHVRGEMEKKLAEAEELASKRFISFDIAGRRVLEDRSLQGTASEVYARLSEALKM